MRCSWRRGHYYEGYRGWSCSGACAIALGGWERCCHAYPGPWTPWGGSSAHQMAAAPPSSSSQEPSAPKKPLHWYKCALRWGAYFGLSTIWAASGAASSPWACLRLPASPFLPLRPPAAAGAHAAVVVHGAPHLRHLGRNLPAALRCHLRRALDRLAPPDRHQLARGRPSAAEP